MRRSLREKLIASGVFALAAITVVVATGIPLRAAGPTAVGLWEQVDENSGKAESWIKISERNGVYEGNIVKIFFKPGQDENWVCSKCEGSDKGAPVLGLKLIKGMQRNGLSYENGTVRDPRDGSVYRASMKVSTDGKKLEMRGYLGISLFGRSQVWNRLPDNALGPPVTSAKSHVQGWRTKETVGSETLQAPPSGLHHVPPPRAVPLQRVMNALQGGVPLSPPADKRLTRRRVRGVLALPELHQHLPATPELHGPARRMNLPRQD